MDVVTWGKFPFKILVKNYVFITLKHKNKFEIPSEESGV